MPSYETEVLLRQAVPHFQKNRDIIAAFRIYDIDLGAVFNGCENDMSKFGARVGGDWQSAIMGNIEFAGRKPAYVDGALQWALETKIALKDPWEFNFNKLWERWAIPLPATNDKVRLKHIIRWWKREGWVHSETEALYLLSKMSRWRLRHKSATDYFWFRIKQHPSLWPWCSPRFHLEYSHEWSEPLS